jgi:hypothetical protein
MGDPKIFVMNDKLAYLLGLILEPVCDVGRCMTGCATNRGKHLFSA